MSNFLTNLGQDALLKGSSSDGAFARLAAAIRLYDISSTPNANGSGFVEVAGGYGYTPGGIALNTTNWTLETADGKRRIRLNNVTWTAAGGSIDNIAGIYIVNAAGNTLAWFEHNPAISILNNDTFTVDSLTVTIR